MSGYCRRYTLASFSQPTSKARTRQDLVSGIALIEPGEIIPCDGIFISGHNVKCDKTGITGESDAVKKLRYSDDIDLHRKSDGQDAIHTDCFMISGAKVLEGVGKYLIVTIGTKSFNRRIMMALRTDTKDTPPQIKLNNLAELIAKLNSIAGLALFAALMIRFFVQLGQDIHQKTPAS
ncbi:E1-E2 ATPase-domain-containing protein [Crepidotus variabilis]|uniref:E1-E2 ATPase-domain-containing protein n=1 Tax=Crepidotus variabilis TaxID=179855 RepID=A0A9P6EGT1_9AGAR|nr:E1-E2 ATPase-domain-containing protein [Crepidotus variabilis]